MTNNTNTPLNEAEYKQKIAELLSRKHDDKTMHSIDNQIDYILEGLPNKPNEYEQYDEFKSDFKRTYRKSREQYKNLILNHPHLSAEEKYGYLKNMLFTVSEENEYPLFVNLYKEKLTAAVKEEDQENGKKKTTGDFKVALLNPVKFIKRISGATIGTEIYNDKNALKIEKTVIKKFANEYLKSLVSEEFLNNLFSEDTIIEKSLRNKKSIVEKLLATYEKDPNTLRRWSSILGPNGENNRVAERDVQVAINSIINGKIIENHIEDKLSSDSELESLISGNMKEKIIDKANSDLVFYSPLDTSKFRAFSKLVADKATKEVDKQFSLVKKASEIVKSEAADAGLDYNESTKTYYTLKSDGSKQSLFTLDSIIEKAKLHETSFSNLRRDGSRGQDKTVSHANILFTMENHIRSTINSAAKEEGVDLRELRLKNKIKSQMNGHFTPNAYVNLDNAVNEVYNSKTFQLDVKTAFRDKKEGAFSETKAINDAIGRVVSRKTRITSSIAEKLRAKPYSYEAESPELIEAVNRIYQKLDTEVVSSREFEKDGKKQTEWFGPLHGYFGMKLAIKEPGIFSKVLSFLGFSNEKASRFSESRHIDNAINAIPEMKERRKDNLTILAINNEIENRYISLDDVNEEQVKRLKKAAKECFEHVIEVKEISGTLLFKDTRKQMGLTFARNNFDEAYKGNREFDYYSRNLKLEKFQRVLDSVVSDIKIKKLESSAVEGNEEVTTFTGSNKKRK